jgi:UTP--glucose-1-phosphate uridylyltransferase
MPAPIRKAVLPVAGLGTRFLPATRAMPKEMLTVVDRPVIQYVVDEAREAGITHLIFVTGRNKSVIEDHFDVQPELDAALAERGKTGTIEDLRKNLPPPGMFSFTRQQLPLGLGHAVWCARELIGDEPFAVLLPDMITRSDPGCLAQMMKVHAETGGNLVSVAECDPELTGQYGIVGVGPARGPAFQISEMVEKPRKANAPSNLYINGRYIFQPGIFAELARLTRGAGGEIQLTDAMIQLSKKEEFFGWTFGGRTFDCGSKAGFLAANFALAMERADIVEDLRAELDAQVRRDDTLAPALRDFRELLTRRATGEASRDESRPHPARPRQPQIETLG